MSSKKQDSKPMFVIQQKAEHQGTCLPEIGVEFPSGVEPSMLNETQLAMLLETINVHFRQLEKLVKDIDFVVGTFEIFEVDTTLDGIEPETVSAEFESMNRTHVKPKVSLRLNDDQWQKILNGEEDA